MAIGKIEKGFIDKLTKAFDKFDAKQIRAALVADGRAANELGKAWKNLGDELTKLKKAQNHLIHLASGAKEKEVRTLESQAQPILEELKRIDGAIEHIRERILVDIRAIE